MKQSCKSGPAFRIRFDLKFIKRFGPISGLQNFVATTDILSPDTLEAIELIKSYIKNDQS